MSLRIHEVTGCGENYECPASANTTLTIELDKATIAATTVETNPEPAVVINLINEDEGTSGGCKSPDSPLRVVAWDWASGTIKCRLRTLGNGHAFTVIVRVGGKNGKASNAFHGLKFGRVGCKAGQEPGAVLGCQNCTFGKYAPEGATKCTMCPPNTYSVEGASECTHCPWLNGVACTRGFAVPQNGFWSPAALFYVDDNKPFGTDTEIFECT